MKGLIGKKVGMTQLYDEAGVLIPVTVVQAGPCKVVAVKTVEKDGYKAVQVGFGTKKAKNVTKAIQGELKKAGITENLPAMLREFRLSDGENYEVGTELKADLFANGDFLDITGTTKGRGFAGVMVRHHFKGGRDGHGGGWHRKPGSIGCRESPGTVMKGKPMAGHLGSEVRTVQNLKIVRIDAEENLLFVNGAIPGPYGGVVIVKKAKKK